MAKFEKVSKINQINQQLTPDERDGILFIASVICNRRPDSLTDLYHCVKNKLDSPEHFIATILKLVEQDRLTDSLCSDHEDVSKHFEGFRYITAVQCKKMKMRALFVCIKKTLSVDPKRMKEFGQMLLCASGVDTNYENYSGSYQLFQLLEEKGCVHVKDSSGLNTIKATLEKLEYTDVLELVNDFIEQEWPPSQPISYTRNPDDRTNDPPPYHPPVMPRMYHQQRSCPPPVCPPLPPSELPRYNSSPAQYCEFPLRHQNQPSHGLHVPSNLPFSSTHQAILGPQNRQHREPIYTNTQSSNPFFPAVPLSFQQQSSFSSAYHKPPAPTYDDRYHNVQGSRPSFQYTPHDQFYNRETPHFGNNSDYMPPHPHQLPSTRPNAYPSHHQVYQSEASPLYLDQAQYGRQHSSPNNQHVVNSDASLLPLSPASNVVGHTSHSPVYHHESLVLPPQSKIGICSTQSGQYQQPAHYQQSSHSTGPSNIQGMPQWSTKQPIAQFPPPVRQCSNDSVPTSLVARRQCYSNSGHSNSFPPHPIRQQQLLQEDASMGPSDVSFPYHVDPVTEKNRDIK